MGGGLARAVAKTVEEPLLLCDRHPEKLEALCRETGGVPAGIGEIASSCRYIFLGVKPQMLGGLLRDLGPVLAKRRDRFVLVSMAAGVTLETVREWAGTPCPVIRIMPNTPVAVGCGMTVYCKSPEVTEEEEQTFCSALAGAGRLDPLEERLIDAASAVAGCGPAFVDLFMESLADGGVKCGLPRSKALQYAAQTVLGSAQLLLETKNHPGELKDAVCSPGGSTIEGVYALERAGFRAAAVSAVDAAYRRTVELGKA